MMLCLSLLICLSRTLVYRLRDLKHIELKFSCSLGNLCSMTSILLMQLILRDVVQRRTNKSTAPRLLKVLRVAWRGVHKPCPSTGALSHTHTHTHYTPSISTNTHASVKASVGNPIQSAHGIDLIKFTLSPSPHIVPR